MAAFIPKDVLAHHVAIVGKTGSGKTSTEKLAVEQAVADGFRVCILDTIKSDWWGITSSADGKKPGLPFKILGGPRGHLPLHSSAGKALGHLVGSGKLPLSVLDMADFEPGGIQRFFVDFAPALMKAATGVLYLVIEEAHELAPKERAGFGAENMAIHWAKKLATAGRSKGIRLIVATQRVQALHNAVLGSCETIIAHRLTAPADQKPILDWLKANAKSGIIEMVSQQMASLRTGSAWVCSGEARIFERMEFRKFKTYDNTSTPTGDGPRHDVKTAPVNLEELRSIMGDAVAEAEANDPTLLKKEIARLQADLQKAQRSFMTQAPDALSAADAAGYARGALEATEKFKAVATSTAGALDALCTVANDLARGLHGLKASSLDEPWLPPAYKPTAPAVKAPAITVTMPPARPAPTNGSGTGDASLSQGERNVLTAVLQYDGIDKNELTLATGYKRSTRDLYLQRLRGKDYITQSGDKVTATDAGRRALPDYEPLPTGQALRDFWLSKLPQGEAKILQFLIEHGAVGKDALGEGTGFKRSTRDLYLQRLRTRRVVVEEGGMVSLAAALR